MPAPDLRQVRSFKDLIRYLEDELHWPLDGYAMEDLTFDYEPADLGLKDEDAAKVKTIRQLRPLTSQQPWGIFFIEFDKKKLPVVLLRRILSHLVVKKRASANKADRAAWNAEDILFVSAFGPEDDDGREIGFAHFHTESGDLPSLRVLGWDGADTTMKLNTVAATLRERLSWPEKGEKLDAWQQRWAGAFKHRIGHVIRTSDMLAEAMAALAKRIRDAATTIMQHETEKGPLKKLHRAFQTNLIHDLTEEGFADTYAQTITYGLFTAALSKTDMSGGRHGTALIASNIIDMVPVTNPFLKEMLATFLNVGGRKGGIDFDELGIQDVVELLRGGETDLPAIRDDFGNRTRGEDPVIHFYEHFLSAYNKQLKIQRGVFYTPQPVVSYIVRSVHELLQTEFGLADTTTWGEMLKKHPGLKLPPLTDEPGEKRTISADEPFVQILDPATGTATFLVEVIDVIHRTLAAKWKQQRLTDAQQRAAWNDYVPQHLLPRLHAFELMMAPYAIAHMKIGLKLAETGYTFGTEERARIYLTNALEPWVKQLPLIGFDALAHEAAAVNEIKRHKRFTVVIGNPPYSKSSGNRSAAAEQLVEEYKRLVRGETNVQPLSDDYVKFIAFAFKTSEQRSSIIAMITNRSYLEGLIHRGLRQTMLSSCAQIFVTDLHGDSNVGETPPPGIANENVFDITQGVAIGIFVRHPKTSVIDCITQRDTWGSRNEKYHALGKLPLFNGTSLATRPPYHFFAPKDLSSQAEQADWVSVEKLFGVSGMGVKSRRDHFLIDQGRKALRERFSMIADTPNIESLRKSVEVTDNPQWTLRAMRDLVRREGVDERIYPILYRPFDTHYIWYHRQAIERGDSRWPVMKHVLPDGLSLLTSRQSTNNDFTSAFIARGLSEMKTAESSRGSYAFPIFVRDDESMLLRGGEHSNIQSQLLAPPLRRKTPIEVLNYVYAVLHSPTYRTRYSAALRIEFPKVPSSCPEELFRALARLGGELTALHLLESPRLAQPITEFIGGRNPEVEKVSWTRDTVWVDKAQTTGFRGVREPVWNFHIGGYQVCEKWLKDRKGRPLADEDIAHYHKIVVALSETIRLMAEIDAVIEQHGGWPGAFQKVQP